MEDFIIHPSPSIPLIGGRSIDLLKTSQLLTDEYAVKILVATVRVPRSAQEISRRFGIPIAACYRRIRDLQKVGLVECQERRLSQEGKRVSFYLSTVKNAYVFFEGGRLRVKFELKTGGADQYGDQWHDIELNPDEQRKKDEDDKGEDPSQ
ncbi:MAG: winged helix-turn-helix domain-containing protein [Methanomassiliicoccales archaeon]|nr:winged helix-turn-helix domain-containing protein [Methanomassiliicoccales archaeon]